MKSSELQDHVFATYVSLRFGMAVVAIAFPIWLWAGGAMQGIPLQDSMSAYYHAVFGDKSMRNWFVGLLFALGILLHLYKGFSKQENIVLNFAGFFAVGVAIIPMEWNCGDVCRKLTWHGTLAISLFLCIAYVCIFRASDTLRLLKNKVLQARYRKLYLLIGGGMVLSPLIALLMTVVFKQFKSYTFFVEAAGIWIFATYWLVKSRELSHTHAERLVLRGKVRISQTGQLH
jgi:hypothetical protein